MPGAVGDEKMEDWLYLNLRNPTPAKIAEGRRVIDAYFLFKMRRRWPKLFEEEPPVMVSISKRRKIPTEEAGKRGDPDAVITCKKCKEPKRAGDNYFHRPDTVSGWGLTCIGCMNVPGRKNGTRRQPDGTFRRTDDLPELPGAGAREVPGPQAAGSSPQGPDSGDERPDGLPLV